MTDFDKNTYPTPLSIFNAIHSEYEFTIDGAALPNNAKCERYITPDDDFLSCELRNERIFINPPFSDPLSFITRAIYLFEHCNCLVVMLLPVDISTKWFALAAEKATEIRFIVGGRVKFLNGATGKYTDVCRGNMFVIFNPSHKGMSQVIRHVHIDSFKGLEWRNLDKECRDEIKGQAQN